MNRFKDRWLAATGLAVTLVLVALPARATVIDPTGDFLSVYAGPKNGDLDVISAGAQRSGLDFVTLTGTHAAAIGTTPGAAYVWGINRGSGIEPFPSNNPPTGEGIYFDAYAILNADGTGTLTDLINGTVKTLDPSSITIAGSTITVRLAASLLPSEGFGFADYLYNLWPRYAPAGVDPGSNTQISDFAPDDKSFAASVPEPATWMMLIGGFSLTGMAMRRRTQRFAA